MPAIWRRRLLTVQACIYLADAAVQICLIAALLPSREPRR